MTDRAQTLEIRNERKKGHILHDSLIYMVLHHMHFVQGKCSDDNLMRKFIEWMITVLRMIQHSYQAHCQSQYSFCSITELNSAPDWSEDFSASLCQDEQTPVLTSCSCLIFCGELFFYQAFCALFRKHSFSRAFAKSYSITSERPIIPSSASLDFRKP